MSTPGIARKQGLFSRCVDSVAEVGIKTKVQIFMLLVGLAPPLACLVLLKNMELNDVFNAMALYVAGLVILFYPLSCLLQEWFVLRQAGHINEYMEEVKKGRKPAFALPAETGDENDLIRLKRNIFWMVQNLGLREERLQSALADLADSRRQLLESIEYASLIQRSFLPAPEEMNEVLGEHLLIWRPRDKVGGDAYWVRQVDGGTFVAVTDCTGHGVPGAFLTLIVNSLLEQEFDEECRSNPALLLTRMNLAMRRVLSRNGAQPLAGDGYEGSICFIDHQDEVLHFAGANGIAFVLRDDDVAELRGSRAGVGFSRALPKGGFFSQSTSLKGVRAAYLATDGMTDQVGGPKNLPFGRGRLKSLLRKHSHLPFAKQRDAILESFKEYQARQEQRDDITLLGFSPTRSIQS